jgi:hypothetical protein
LNPYYLRDTLALARLAHPRVAARLEPLRKSGLVVLNHDRNLGIIAGIPGRPTEWIVPAGTVA